MRFEYTPASGVAKLGIAIGTNCWNEGLFVVGFDGVPGRLCREGRQR